MTNGLYQFDDIRVEPHTFTVLKAETPVVLEPKTFLLLVFLIENRERLVDKREILDVIWKDTAVTENALTREIGKLRKSLGDDPKTPRYIQTVHTRGYRFIGALDDDELAADAVLPPPDAPRGRRGWLSPKLLGVLGAIVVLVVAAIFLKRNVAAANKPSKPPTSTLVVLPFQSLDAGANDQYLGLAMADALITKLTGSNRLSVQPTSAISHYVDTRQNSLAIGRDLKVDYVLEGRFQARSDRVRVTVQLLCVSCDKTARWAGSFDEKSADKFGAEDAISEKMAGALTSELTGEPYKRQFKRPTANQEAFMAYAKGMVQLPRDTKESLDKATAYFEQAVAQDPNFAGAWAQLSDCYRRQEWYGAAPADVMAKTRAAAVKAAALDDELSYAHTMLGFVAFQYDWKFETAEREYERTVEIQPSFSHQWFARMFLATNRQAEAEKVYRRFLTHMSTSMAGTTNAAQFLYLTGQYDRATIQLHDTLAMDPNYAPAHEMLGLVYEQQKRPEALEELKKAVDLSHGLFGLGSLGHFYATSGKSADAQKTMQELAAQTRHRYVGPYEIALVHAGQGENRKALEDLEKAFAERSLSAQCLRFDPRLKKVRNEPGFREFVKRIGLPF